MKEITLEELRNLPEGSYELIDIRDDGLVLYGMMPGAVNISIEEIESGDNSKISAIDSAKKLIFYCQIGRLSREIDEDTDVLRGRDCYSLEGGYIGYIKTAFSEDTDYAARQSKAEESIRRKFSSRNRHALRHEIVYTGTPILIAVGININLHALSHTLETVRLLPI